jgi:hypothetical protein
LVFLTASTDSIPFTDREYNKGSLSESTSLELGSGHSGDRFRYTKGNNDLTYEIYRGGKDNKQVVELGSPKYEEDVRRLDRKDRTPRSTDYYLSLKFRF